MALCFVLRTNRRLLSGDWLQLIPADIATAFALHDFVYGVRDGRLEEVWSVSARGAILMMGMMIGTPDDRDTHRTT